MGGILPEYGSWNFKNAKYLFMRNIFAILALFIAFGTLISCKKETSPDVATEAKFKGTINDLKLPPKGSEKEIEHLLIKIGDDTLDIYLCPKSFIDDMGVSFAKGDEIAFTGSKVKQGDAEMILAREVVKGTDTLVLRDAKGVPVWNWHK